MFCNVSPEEPDRNESLCSLKFAERVRAVALGPAQKSASSAAELSKLKGAVSNQGKLSFYIISFMCCIYFCKYLIKID